MHPPPERILVTIDGPAAVGKSSVARAAAKRLGLDFLNTGAMYRAATALALDRGVDPLDPFAVADLAAAADLRFDWAHDPPMLMAFGLEIMSRLSDADVNAWVSRVADHEPLRRLLVRLQQEIGREHPRLMTEGRDQGSEVFPGAAVKIYLDATARARAVRRADQLRRERGSLIDVDRMERDIIDRDEHDRARVIGALRQPPDAVRIDTSGLGFEEVVALVVDAALRRAPWIAGGPAARRGPGAAAAGQPR